MNKSIVIIFLLLSIATLSNGQRFGLSIGAAGGYAQMDGDRLYGFDKFIYKAWVQPVYRHNKIFSTVFRLGFGSNGSKYPGSDMENSIQELKVSHNFYELFFMLGEQISFGGSKKKPHPHSILIGISLNRNFDWSTSTNQNKFALDVFEVDPTSFKSQGNAFHFSYLYRITPKLSVTALFDYYMTDMLEKEFLEVIQIYPITIGAGLQVNI